MAINSFLVPVLVLVHDHIAVDEACNFVVGVDDNSEKIHHIDKELDIRPILDFGLGSDFGSDSAEPDQLVRERSLVEVVARLLLARLYKAVWKKY